MSRAIYGEVTSDWLVLCTSEHSVQEPIMQPGSASRGGQMEIQA